MTKKQKKMLLRIVLSALMLAVFSMLPVEGLLRFVLYMLPYGLVGYDILWKAWKGIRNGQMLDENFLMAIATVGAIVLAVTQTGDYVEAVLVMLFYQIGELFQSYAVGKSRKNVAKLMDIRPDYANISVDGELQQVDPEEIGIGTWITVFPGEKIPIDGIVRTGTSVLDTAALTGESVPREIGPGDSCVSGCINLTGILQIETTREFGESTVSRILELVENASSHKSRSEHFISRFARVYTPAVCGSALALAVLPPIAQLITGGDGNWGLWLYRALTFLVASCPCALVISIPLSFFAGIGGASRAGVLVKGSNYLEALAKTSQVVFDKTGTLTEGVFSVSRIESVTMPEARLLELAAHAEYASSHPISKSLCAAYGKPIQSGRVTDLQLLSGMGVIAKVDGREVAAGNGKLMEKLQIPYRPAKTVGTIVYLSVDGSYAGLAEIKDSIKRNASAAIKELKRMGVRQCVMLTGDARSVASQVAAELEIGDFYSDLLPQDKVSRLEELLSRKKKGVLAFVGDGINDAPVLSRADIGIAMGAMGSDAAIEAADIVLMDDDPGKIPYAIRIARKCVGIVYQNIFFAIGIKLLALVLVAVGAAGMWLAIFADVGVMVLAVLNAVRALILPRKAENV